MAMSIRDQIAANTANLKPAKDIKSTAKATQPRKPRTAPGMMGALAAAESKIRELEQQGATTEVDVDLIVPNPFQPRRIFDAEKMQELIRNIEEQGLIQPVVLRANPLEEGRYQLVVGERRLRAHIELKRKTIKALIVDLDDVQMSSWALSENMSRSDLSDYEIALGVVACMSNFASRRELAENLGISRSHLYRYFAFQELPDFITDSLNEKPWLLGANAAQDIKSFLNNGAAPELQALAACWPKG